MRFNRKGAAAAGALAVLLGVAVLLLSQQSAFFSAPAHQSPSQGFIDLAGNADFSGVQLDPLVYPDIPQLRSWNTKAFPLLEANEIKWRVWERRIHFWDSEKWVDLGLMSYPTIEKKDFLLEKPPAANGSTARFKIDNYLLHKGITASVNQNNEIVFTDANKSEIKKIAPAFAVDAQQNLAIGQYSLLQKQQKLEIFVDFSAEWLNKAAYPVIIDPDTNYLSAKADGYLFKFINGSCTTSVYTVTPTGAPTASTITVGQWYGTI